jgi:hypothetical protein
MDPIDGPLLALLVFVPAVIALTQITDGEGAA